MNNEIIINEPINQNNQIPINNSQNNINNRVIFQEENKNINNNFDINEMNEKIQNDSFNFSKKAILEIINQNHCLCDNLRKMQETINFKDQLISEYESVIKLSKDKITKLSNQIPELKRENDVLRQNNITFQNNLNEEKLRTKNITQPLKNPKVKENNNKKDDDDDDDEYLEKEINLEIGYKQKEKELKNEFANEIDNLTKKADELKVENDRLKYELADKNIEIEKLNSQIENEQFNNSSIINKQERDIQKLKDKVSEYEKKNKTLGEI